MSSAPEVVGPNALERWLGAEDPDAAVPRFRRIFCAIVLAYDVIDVALGATDGESDWFPHPRDGEMLVLQLLLIVCGSFLVAGKRVYLFGIVAAALRFWQARIFALNDFHFYAVVTLLVAHERGGPFAGGPKHPKWVRDALLAQLAFVYAATAWLKLGDAWMSGGEIFVRTTYLALAHRWPYPGFVRAALESVHVCAWLARLAVVGEFALAGLLAVRHPKTRPFVIALAVAIHAFGTLVTNVWFFSAAMVSAAFFLMPGRVSAQARESSRRRGRRAPARGRAPGSARRARRRRGCSP